MKQSWTQVKIQREKLLFVGLPVFLIIFVFTPWQPVQFVCLFFIFLILLSRLYSEYLIRHLQIRRRDPELRGFRYEWIEIELAVENSGRLPAFMLVAGDSPGTVAVFRDHKSLFTLPGKRRRIFHWQIYGSNRGFFTLGPAQIRSSDPLGLFPFTLKSG